MEEFGVIHTALKIWERVCDVRKYHSLRFIVDAEHICEPLSWPIPPFPEFFTWCLRQPGFILPHIQLEGCAPCPHLESFSPEEEEEDYGPDLDNTAAITDNLTNEAATPLPEVPALVVFAHSTKFEKGFNPTYGVDIRTDDNLGIGEMRDVVLKVKAFLRRHMDAPMIHINLILYCNVTSPSAKYMFQELAPYQTPTRRIVSTIFSMKNDLHWYMLDHHLVLPHHVLTDAEIETELRSKGVDVLQLPRIRTSDPVARIMGLCPGTVVRIDVPLDAVQDHIYRIVVEAHEYTFEDGVLEEDDTEETH